MLYEHYIIHEKLGYDLEPPTLKEITQVIKQMKKNKSPGPDGIPMELFKEMDVDNLTTVLSIIRNWWQKEDMPEELLHAKVALLYKKGDPSDMDNYRPISLLQTFYKILAALIKERIDAGLDAWIYKTQYGFRANKSTTQAIFIARRLQDIAEKTEKNIAIILLDWEKAFDKIDHERLLEVLARVQVPPKMLQLISELYKSPKFKVKCGTNTSEYEMHFRKGRLKKNS